MEIDGEMSISYRDYGFGGLRIRSFIGVAGWVEQEVAAAEPDVWIRGGPVEAAAAEGGPHASRVTSEGDDLVIAVRGVARYRVVGGKDIVVDVEADARPEDVQLYLTGAAIGAILHQRGVFPLHASAVLVRGSAVALTGPSRAGKSTLAAALSRRGYTLLTDDMAPLVGMADGRIGMWLGTARLKLDPVSLNVVKARADGLSPAGGTRSKFQLPVSRAGVDEGSPVPLRCIYVLRDGEGVPRIERLGALDAMGAVGGDVYFPGFVVLLGLEEQWFRLAARVVGAVEVRRLTRPRGLEHLDRVIEVLEEDWGTAQAGPER